MATVRDMHLGFFVTAAAKLWHLRSFFGIVSEKGEREGRKIVLLILSSVVQRQLHLS
jgi:hypothetical protein